MSTITKPSIKCHDNESCYCHAKKVQGHCMRCNIFQYELAKKPYACPECWPVFCMAQGYPPCPGSNCQKAMQGAREFRTIMAARGHAPCTVPQPHVAPDRWMGEFPILPVVVEQTTPGPADPQGPQTPPGPPPKAAPPQCADPREAQTRPGPPPKATPPPHADSQGAQPPPEPRGPPPKAALPLGLVRQDSVIHNAAGTDMQALQDEIVALRAHNAAVTYKLDHIVTEQLKHDAMLRSIIGNLMAMRAPSPNSMPPANLPPDLPEDFNWYNLAFMEEEAQNIKLQARKTKGDAAASTL